MLHQGAVDIGQGSNTVIAQICADALGLPLGAFRLKSGDTGDHAGRRQDVGVAADLRDRQGRGKGGAGAARKDAALRQCFGRRRSYRSTAPCWRSTRAANAGASISPAFQSMPTASCSGLIETYDPPTTSLDAKGQGKPYAVYGYGAQIAELEVDMRLGTVKLVKITAAHDVGKAINPMLAEGQVEGGIAQGIGMALMEEYIPGRTENLHDYLIPTIGDVPEIETIMSRSPIPRGRSAPRGWASMC